MKIALALSGGGAKGAAHIGVIKALEEENIKIDIISGTSSGSIVAILYALGFSTDDILKLFNEFAKVLVETSPRYLIKNIARNKNFLPEGMRSGENIELAVKQVTDFKNIKTIDQISMPIAIPAVDAVTGEEFIFTNNHKNGKNYIKDIEIGKAVRASCSFPGIYAPCNYSNHIFLDGGILDNVPVIEAKKLGADKVIAISFGADSTFSKSNIYTVLMRSLEIMTNDIANKNLKEADYNLEIKLNNVGVLDIGKINECYNKGYEEMKKSIKNIKKAINEQTNFTK